jgi:hypothetical protein
VKMEGKCPTCSSQGFDVSVLGPDRCTFCDGSEGGNPPTEEDIKDAEEALMHSNQNG